MNDDNGSDDDKIVSLRPDAAVKERTYDRTILDSHRRYRPDNCPHKGPYFVDKKLAAVECGDCGALLNPIYVLEMLAAHEAYWNLRQRELGQYLKEVNKELEERTRTRCTHCGNMTAIRLKKEVPKTWFPMPY